MSKVIDRTIVPEGYYGTAIFKQIISNPTEIHSTVSVYSSNSAHISAIGVFTASSGTLADSRPFPHSIISEYQSILRTHQRSISSSYRLDQYGRDSHPVVLDDFIQSEGIKLACIRPLVLIARHSEEENQFVVIEHELNVFSCGNSPEEAIDDAIWQIVNHWSAYVLSGQSLSPSAKAVSACLQRYFAPEE